MYLKGFIGVLLVISLISSCTFVPKVSDNQENLFECSMFTRKLTLSATKYEDGMCDDVNLETCLLGMAIVVPAGSLVVSGSLVLIGNTLHWLEYQGTCNNGFIIKNYEKFKTELQKI